MVAYCCVSGCGNNSNNTKKDPNSKISYHVFPSCPEHKIKWLRAIGRPNWTPPCHARVCSTHFINDQINCDGFRIRLKDDAVPSNLLPSNSNFEASDVEACRICLATDVKLYSLLDTVLGACMENISEKNGNFSIGGLPQFVCYQCRPHLIKSNELIEKCITSQTTLLDIFAKNGQITKSLIKEHGQNELKLSPNNSMIAEIISNFNMKTSEWNDSDMNHLKNENEIEMSDCKIEENDFIIINYNESSPLVEVVIPDNNCGEDSSSNDQDAKISTSKVNPIRKKITRTKKKILTQDVKNILKGYKLSEKNLIKKYRCEKCDMGFASEKARRVHILTSIQHAKRNTQKPERLEGCGESGFRKCCKKCGKDCGSYKGLVQHNRAEHGRAPRPSEPWRGVAPYPISCELCEETLTTRRKHWVHVLKHHPKDVDTYQPIITAVCDICGKGYQNATKLGLHKLRHRSPTVRCQVCSRMFYDKHSLMRHARTHKPDKPHQCRICGRAFKAPSNLDRHARVHTDAAPYECTMCGKKFKYSSSMNLHVRTVHYKLTQPSRKKRNKSAKDDSDS